jgi:hypothetical protein
VKKKQRKDSLENRQQNLLLELLEFGKQHYLKSKESRSIKA